MGIRGAAPRGLQGASLEGRLAPLQSVSAIGERPMVRLYPELLRLNRLRCTFEEPVRESGWGRPGLP
eukprot:11646070-Alexandrium_andersonii.AAC.1